MANNTLRGRLAEFLVAHALGLAQNVRSEWEAYDLQLPDGRRIEVKSSAYIQAWAQHAESVPSFAIGPTRAWDPSTNAWAPADARRRQADLYVFALLAHRERATVNPLDLTQWVFYVLPAAVLDARVAGQRRIGLARLLGLDPVVCGFLDLKEGVMSFPLPTA